MDSHTKAAQAQSKSKPIEPKVKELVARCKSIIMATADKEGNLNSSYAPYAKIGNKLYILISFMARHTKNITETNKASVLFIEDESETKQIYARERLTFDAVTQKIERNTPLWDEAIAALTASHGKILEILVGMQDFIMIEISPVKGSYVNGFGSAYVVNGDYEIVNHKNDVNHTIEQK
ncbi:MAG: pyridoxamine 5'-phosphate oxidase family protein [Bacteroidota bacterium]|nr:pyridoxamine 5'-phosphate oxidase family protein [Bacteroidota bacterium]